MKWSEGNRCSGDSATPSHYGIVAMWIPDLRAMPSVACEMQVNCVYIHQIGEQWNDYAGARFMRQADITLRAGKHFADLLDAGHCRIVKIDKLKHSMTSLRCYHQISLGVYLRAWFALYPLGVSSHSKWYIRTNPLYARKSDAYNVQNMHGSMLCVHRS